MRSLSLLKSSTIVGLALVLGSLIGPGAAQQPMATPQAAPIMPPVVPTKVTPAPVPPAPVVNPAPVAPVVVVPVHPAPGKRVFPRGALSSRHHWLAYEATKDPRFSHAPKAAPAQFTPAVIPTPAQMNMWGNSTYGDCVTAEEFAAKYGYPMWFSAAGKPLNMPESLAISWARQGGFLNGANLTDVMDVMVKSGVAFNGTTYTDGPYTSVDYTNWATLTSAIAQGPVKIGVASSQFDNVQGVGEQNGWIMSGFRNNQNEDHCVGLWGYGTMSQLCTIFSVTPPANAAQYTQCLVLYTWDSLGIIDFASMNAITAEAWLRTPTTPQTVPPQPGPTPPTPGSFTYALTGSVPTGATIDPATGIFSWAVPTSQAAGTTTVTFTAANSAGTATGLFTIVVSATATGAPVIATIPGQSAAIGGAFSLNLSTFVSVPTPAPGH